MKTLKPQLDSNPRLGVQKTHPELHGKANTTVMDVNHIAEEVSHYDDGSFFLNIANKV
jgi:hypothetical protein